MNLEGHRGLKGVNLDVALSKVETESGKDLLVGNPEKCVAFRAGPSHCLILLDDGPNEQEIYESLFFG
jgi:hypothetical protein